jgi:hypothetical protein
MFGSKTNPILFKDKVPNRLRTYYSYKENGFMKNWVGVFLF